MGRRQPGLAPSMGRRCFFAAPVARPTGLSESQTSFLLIFTRAGLSAFRAIAAAIRLTLQTSACYGKGSYPL